VPHYIDHEDDYDKDNDNDKGSDPGLRFDPDNNGPSA